MDYDIIESQNAYVRRLREEAIAEVRQQIAEEIRRAEEAFSSILLANPRGNVLVHKAEVEEGAKVDVAIYEFEIREDGVRIEARPTRAQADLRAAELEKEFGVSFSVRRVKKEHDRG